MLKKRIFLLLIILIGNFHVSIAGESIRTETIEFEPGNRFSISINIPDDWQIRHERGTSIPGASRTYDLILTPPYNEKGFLRITTGATGTGRSLPMQQFERIIDARVSALLPRAVEERAVYVNLPVNNGIGILCILTDASLVNTTIPQDEYLYLGIYFANYNNGCIVCATLLADDTHSMTFLHMLGIVSSIIPKIGN